MYVASYEILERKIIIKIKNRICETPEELLSSPLLRVIVKKAIAQLEAKGSRLLSVFGSSRVTPQAVRSLIEALKLLTKMDAGLAAKVSRDTEPFFRDKALLNDLVEYLYNYWRSFDRFIVCDSPPGSGMDQRPFRTFNNTIEHLTHLVRATYRDIQENITGEHPRVYRQVRAGAEVATIAVSRKIGVRSPLYAKLNAVPMIRQVLLYPPLILKPPMNKRSGQFTRVDKNPLSAITVDREEWLCYPAKVGTLVIYIYFHKRFYELGFSLSNLFEIAADSDLKRKPDAVYLFGAPPRFMKPFGEFPTVFFEDDENDLLVAAVPNDDRFGYFGYLKKMVLTLHNIKMMKTGKMPFHGAMVSVILKGGRRANVLLIGDSGAGKSETLEALRTLGRDAIQDLVIIADDMGSLSCGRDGKVLAYGTEIGAFLRLDDLSPGYAFGQIDRAIIMSPSRVNARIVLPVTSYAQVVRGYPIDYILYANNYEEVDAEHPVVERIRDMAQALKIFREGTVMSKGTTTTTGITHSYFANIFGPPQYKDLHERIAKKYFTHFFKNDIFVGQMRTRLGIAGYEQEGPAAAARALFDLI